MPADAEVIVVGAGVAGLTCALALEAAGIDAHVVEAADAVGGRIRTDHVDGYLLDRGFQVLNPAYPRVREYADLDALQIRPFAAGLGVKSPRFDELQVVADWRREPTMIARTLRSGKLHPASVATLARWAGPALVSDWAIETLSPDDVPRAESMDKAGFTGPLRALMDRFLAGVLLEDDGSTSTAFTRMMIRKFWKAAPGLPLGGMQQLPEQLAARLTRPVSLNTRVEDVSPGVVRTADGQTLTASLVVVATAPPAAAELTGAVTPAGKGVTTHWFAVDEAPTDLKMIIVDAREEVRGPVINTAVMTNVAPEYAPAGKHLVQASSLLKQGAPRVTDDAVRAHLTEIYGVDTAAWELIHRHDIPYALPEQRAPFVPNKDMEIEPGLIVAGGWVDHASIQGAMVSGERAAQGWIARTKGTAPVV